MAHVELVEAGKEDVAPEVELDLGVGGGERRLNVVVIPGVGDPLAILRGLLSR